MLPRARPLRSCCLPYSRSDCRWSRQFLAQAEATILLDFRSNGDSRALELVNKTNQFNLNGVRFTDAEWRAQLDAPGAFLLVAGYQDKFGPLGKIAVLQGRLEGYTLLVGTWVMSCRAFARRIEHCCLDSLFRRFPVNEMRFSFAATSKNSPLRQFLADMLGAEPEAPYALSRERFLEKRPNLYHKVNEHNGPRERLAQCFRVVFPNLKDDTEIFAATQATLPEWDSVAAIMLVNVLEEEFQIEMDFEVLGDLTSFDLVLDYLKSVEKVS